MSIPEIRLSNCRAVNLHIVTTKEQADRLKLSPDLFAWLDEVEDKYANAIKDLANK